MDNSKVKPESIKFLSLNVRGLSNFHKRRTIFSWCRKQKTDLIFLQETHSTIERQDQWRKEWGAPVLFSHGSTNARGVAILVKNSLNITIQQSEISSDGRFIVLKADINNETYTIANVYGPNKDADAVKFYRNLSKLLRNDEFGNEENIIIGRDFNCPLDITLDKKGGLPIPRKYVINSIDELQNEFSLHDIWRLKNPTLQSFTWGCCSPFIFCRLDYWLISDKLHDLVTKVDIIPSIKTDHSAIFLELEEIESTGRGAGFWKLNTSLLTNENYKHMITNSLPTWLEAGKDIHDPRLLWDWIKFNIRSHSIIFSKQIASIRRKQEEELNIRYQEAVLMFQTNPCDNTRLALEKCKQDFEAPYEKKVEGIILRARARWHEHGEKNSKYFLNLEKRNHVKKHVRKLHISGVISTDPFMIMESQRSFYMNLYSSRTVNLDNTESSIFFDSPNLPSTNFT